MSNRAFKVQLWEKDSKCHWCHIPTQLTYCPNGIIPSDGATVDHLYSRFDVRRWVKRKPGERHKVLACYACNQRRSIEETERLSKEEILMRSQGFSLNPIGKPHIIHPFDTLEEVLAHLIKVVKKPETKKPGEVPAEKYIDISSECDKVTV
jgi:hypothetical protein